MGSECVHRALWAWNHPCPQELKELSAAIYHSGLCNGEWLRRFGVRHPGCVNPLNAELNPICHFLALLGAHHILHVGRIRVNQITKY